MARPKKPEAANTNDTSASPPNAAAEAFAKIEPELAALPAEQVAPIEIDVSSAVSVALATAARLKEHRDAIAEQLPKHPIEQIDNLATYAQAASYAHLVHTYVNGADAAKALLEEATKLRDGLLIAAEALAHRNLLDADEVAKIRKGSGNADMGSDLVALAALFQADWGKVSSKTAVERHEVDRARELGPAVLIATHAKKQANKSVDTADQRARAFALLAAANDSCRQALAYLRWKEGDADTIAPSLFKKRAGRKPGKKGEEGEAAPEATEG